MITPKQRTSKKSSKESNINLIEKIDPILSDIEHCLYTEENIDHMKENIEIYTKQIKRILGT